MQRARYSARVVKTHLHIQYIMQGKVTREVSSSVFHVEYDDGEAHDENLSQDTFKWHGPRASNAAEPYHSGMRPAMLILGAVNARAEGIEVSSTLTSHNVCPPK